MPDRHSDPASDPNPHPDPAGDPAIASARLQAAPRPAPGVYRFENLVPVVDPSAYVHPAATLIGDVIIGADVYVGPGAVLRGDFGRITLARGANLQDNCVVHARPDIDTLLDEDSHIGHGAIIHACVIGRDTLVGMNAVVMDLARVGEQTMVAAMSFVKIGAVIAPRSLVAGIPARVVRPLTDADLESKQWGTRMYHELARRCRTGLVPAEPLTAVEADRPRSDWSNYPY